MTNSPLPQLPQPFMGILNSETEEVKWVCYARHLHEYLGVKDQFPRWMRRQLQKHNLVPEVDYASFNQPQEFPSGIRYRVEYLLTTKAAASIAFGIDPAKSDALINHFDAATGDDVDSADAPESAQPAQSAQPPTVTKKQVAYIKTLIKALVSSGFYTFNSLYALLRKEFNFSSCEQIPVEKYDAVCAFLEDEIAYNVDDEYDADESSADIRYSLANPAHVKTPASAQHSQPESEQPKLRRFLNTLSPDGLKCTELSATALVIEPDAIADWIANPENRISNQLILCITQACFVRLAASK